MINKLKEMLDSMNSQPCASEGFSAQIMYTTGMEFGLTCKEVKDIFLGKEKALSRGKYPATASAELLAEAEKAPTVTTAKKAAKKNPTRNSSTIVIEKKVKKDDAASAARRALIAEIATRHRDEDALAEEFSVNSSNDFGKSDDETVTALESLMNQSVINPANA